MFIRYDLSMTARIDKPLVEIVYTRLFCFRLFTVNSKTVACDFVVFIQIARARGLGKCLIIIAKC